MIKVISLILIFLLLTGFLLVVWLGLMFWKTYYHSIKCPNCSHHLHYNNMQDDEEGNNYYVFKCPSCGYIENIPAKNLDTP